MEDLVARFAGNLLGRLTGPMQFRLVLQPLMALIFAARAGMRDAKSGRAPYFWSLFSSNRAQWRQRLGEGWADVGRVFVLALIIDAVYQVVTVRWFYPLETLVVAVILAFLPYLFFRGAFTRLWGIMGVRPGRPTKDGGA
jgi:hypothetical protein